MTALEQNQQSGRLRSACASYQRYRPCTLSGGQPILWSACVGAGFVKKHRFCWSQWTRETPSHKKCFTRLNNMSECTCTVCPKLSDSTMAQPEYSVGPSSVRQRNAISMAFRWRADVGPLLDAYCGRGGGGTELYFWVLNPWYGIGGMKERRIWYFRWNERISGYYRVIISYLLAHQRD